MTYNNEDGPIYSMLSGKCSSGFVLSNFPVPNCNLESYLFSYQNCYEAVSGSGASVTQNGDGDMFDYGSPNGTYNFSPDAFGQGIDGSESGYLRTGNNGYLFMHNKDYSCSEDGYTGEFWVFFKPGCDSWIIATAPGTRGNFPTTGWTLTQKALGVYRGCEGCGANDPTSFNLTFNCL
jgi:hypothetical protein